MARVGPQRKGGGGRCHSSYKIQVRCLKCSDDYFILKAENCASLSIAYAQEHISRWRRKWDRQVYAENVAASHLLRDKPSCLICHIAACLKMYEENRGK